MEAAGDIPKSRVWQTGEVGGLIKGHNKGDDVRSRGEV